MAELEAAPLNTNTASIIMCLCPGLGQTISERCDFFQTQQTTEEVERSELL